MIAMLASFGSVMITIGYILLAVLILLLMIMIHELGHYTFGKIFGFKIEEFAIGFGKAIFKKTLKSGEVFSIRLIPLGGYCAFAGEDDDNKDPRAFNNMACWKRLIVQFGGVLFNFISAIIFAFILLVAFGYDVPKVSEVDQNFQNTEIIQEGDVLRQIDGKTIDFITDNTANAVVENYATSIPDEEWLPTTINGKNYLVNNSLSLGIERDGEMLEPVYANIYILLNDNGEREGIFLGLSTVPYQHTFVEGLARCVPLAAAFAWKVLVFLWMLITGGIGLSDVGGPFTTIATIAEYSQTNIANLFVFLPFIAANLAIFNLLPIPALDGARMVFTTVEWIRGKPINRKVEGTIHTVGLLVLFAFVIFVDLYHLFT